MVQNNIAIAAPAKGNTSNVINLMIQQYDAAPEPKPTCFIFNVPLATVDSASYDAPEFWTTIENLLDGELSTIKYKGACRYIPKPHVFILSNSDLKRRYEHITINKIKFVCIST